MPCQACGRNAPTKYVEFYQNIGMLVLRSMRSVKGNLCRRCIKRYFMQLTGLTLLTGWWGMISLILNPFLILNNVIRSLGSLGLADSGEGALPVQPVGRPSGNVPSQPGPSALGSYRQDVAMRLRGGQSTQEIVTYLAPRAGVTPAAAQQFVESVKRDGPVASR
jgi:hypothetical protein